MEKKRAVVVGGSRGLGRGAVEALSKSGFEVVAIGRDEKALAALGSEVAGVLATAGDATDEALAERTLREYRPDLVVICAGAQPALGPFHELTWEQFETNWRADAKIAFVW